MTKSNSATTTKLIEKISDMMVAYLKDKPYGEYEDFCCSYGPPKMYFVENLQDVEYVSQMIDYHKEESESNHKAIEITIALAELERRLKCEL